MYSTPRITSSCVLACQSNPGALSKALFSLQHVPAAVTIASRRTVASAASNTGHAQSSDRHSSVPKRRLSFTSKVPARAKDAFAAKSTDKIWLSKPAWAHPIYTEDEMNRVNVAHREARNWSDWTALGFVRLLRFGLDLATGYRHDPKGNPKGPDGKPITYMNARKYMIRNIFLESVAGVPGMVGGMMRHLHSMRRLKRDQGWMETLLEESYNERMHLLTFLKMHQPGWFMKTMVLGAQGVFFNGFFLAYLISPRTAHRFVGYLEEEAVLTYTREIAAIDEGKIPEWEDMDAPDIAVGYWNMPEGHRKMRDLLKYIRADEAKHREVNHTLGNLDQKQDPNPFVSEYKDDRPHPDKSITHLKQTGWERDEVI
ncbi:MAG: hypothetical protein M1831_005541 [Alyxoria varia]|nr:MAG: hypothetical protein M1831_005541 [Alyxoria varia]